MPLHFRLSSLTAYERISHEVCRTCRTCRTCNTCIICIICITCVRCIAALARASKEELFVECLFFPKWPLDDASGIVRDNLQGIHARIKLLRNAIEQSEGTPDQQQSGGNSADALANLHSDVDRSDIFPALSGLVVAE